MRPLLWICCLFMSHAVFGDDRLSVDSAADAERMALWQGPAPVGDGATDNANAWITIHQPATSNDGTAIIICPGGGFRTQVVGPEGHGIAAWLNRHGINPWVGWTN